MTSVPSRLPLLSGSSFYISLIVAVLFLIPACKTQQEAKTDITDKSTDPVAQDQDTLRIDLPDIDSLLANIDSFRLKDRYNIAYILPFYLDSLSQDSLKENPDYFYQDAEMAAKFYLGAKTALDSLERLGFNAKVHVFDSENSLGNIVGLKKSGALDSMDLIIGPIYNSNVRYLSKWAKQKEKILVNPLSPTSGLAKDNPWFIQINPSIPTHIESLFSLLKYKFATDNKIIINQPIKNELNYQSLWKDLAIRHNVESDSIKSAVEFPKVPIDSLAFKYLILGEEENDLLKENKLIEDTLFTNMLQDSVRNILIINSIDRTFISRLNRNLYKLSDEYEITVIGLPVWSAVEDFRMDYLEKFNLHYSGDFYIDSSFYNSNFYKNTIDSLYMHPNAYFLKGYDISMWMGLGLMKYGLDMNTELIDEQLKGIHTSFRLGNTYELAKDSSKSMNYLENKYVHLLNISDYIIHDVRKTNKEIK
jgi:hypothetical protein